MQLPFTREQFFDLFAAYNAAVWPALVVLWIASAVVSVLLLSSRRPPGRWISALLAAHWIWSAVAYHAVFFTRINPAAWLFAALFVAQAALFFWAGVVHRRLSFAPRRNAWAVVAVIGGSAAFLLGAHADSVLPLAGLALAVLTIQGSSARGMREAHQTLHIRVKP